MPVQSLCCASDFSQELRMHENTSDEAKNPIIDFSVAPKPSFCSKTGPAVPRPEKTISFCAPHSQTFDTKLSVYCSGIIATASFSIGYILQQAEYIRNQNRTYFCGFFFFVYFFGIFGHVGNTADNYERNSGQKTHLCN